MKTAQMNRYFKQRFASENWGGGVWQYSIKDDDEGFCQVRPMIRILTHCAIVRCEIVINPRFIQELANIIFKSEHSGKNCWPHLYNLGSCIRHEVPSKVVEESDLEAVIQTAMDMFNERCDKQVVAMELAKRYQDYQRRLAEWQALHLITCVFKGDVNKLEGYLKGFETGDKLGFNPTIEQVSLERAIPIAKQYRSGELICPISF